MEQLLPAALHLVPQLGDVLQSNLRLGGEGPASAE